MTMPDPVAGLLLTTDLNAGERVLLPLAEPDRLDTTYLSGTITLGEGNTEREVVDVEEFDAQHLIVAKLGHPGDRPHNAIAAALLDRIMPTAANRWWLDVRGGVVLAGRCCLCGHPADLPTQVYDLAEVVSHHIPRGRNR
ncbi:hypothetical protein GCM10023194_81510 [Planotetraspora phitsanulokensis]|uniref:Uncharacterized protein n=1 Tax=Planotetraspora phitsanulokensis TaxID=575192 RepID=A0A8J3UCD7_9ACTN|nr:hypothetical protein [Planotetraspora phitsanulokensis]GII42883.1 hypothetical protein Pph01_78860 [Planotetraspora phitsanulokensis]